MVEENTELKLDNPLVVHKKGDASYDENAYDDKMTVTHYDEGDEPLPTLERHRFRKEKKSHKGVWFLLVLVAVVVSVMCGLFYGDKLTGNKVPEASESKPSRTYLTTEQNEFKGVITVKGTYIFFEGTEVDGLKGLESEIKYLEKGTKFTIQDESADSNFLNYEVLSLLSKYELNYDITHIVSSGLKSKYETTAKKTTSTTKKSKSKNKPKPTKDSD